MGITSDEFYVLRHRQRYGIMELAKAPGIPYLLLQQFESGMAPALAPAFETKVLEILTGPSVGTAKIVKRARPWRSNSSIAKAVAAGGSLKGADPATGTAAAAPIPAPDRYATLRTRSSVGIQLPLSDIINLAEQLDRQIQARGK